MQKASTGVASPAGVIASLRSRGKTHARSTKGPTSMADGLGESEVCLDILDLQREELTMRPALTDVLRTLDRILTS